MAVNKNFSPPLIGQLRGEKKGKNNVLDIIDRKIARKVSHSSQAEEGAKTREVLMSVMQTLRKRVRNPRQKFKEVLDTIALNSDLNLSEAVLRTDSG